MSNPTPAAPNLTTLKGSGLRLAAWGEGPRAVLALHGWGGSHLTFAPLIPHLPPDVSLYAPDLPGYGASPPLRDWAREAYVERLVELIDQLPHERFTLLGNCSGAILGLSALLSRTERVDRVVMLDAFAFTPWYFGVFLWPVLGPLAFWSTFANPAGRWLTNASLARHRANETHLTSSFERVPVATSWNTLRILDEIGTPEPFSAISVPTTLIHGERTFGAVKASLPRWRQVWPHLEAVGLEGVGHLPIVEAPAEVARLAFAAPGVSPR
jgi:pimeloyl-ACP methyl ester carboxylesterase